jgi:hypothetical protein
MVTIVLTSEEFYEAKMKEYAKFLANGVES